MSKELIDLHTGEKEKALLAVVETPHIEKHSFSSEEEKEELESLVKSSGCLITESIISRVNKINPALFIGKGKAEEIAWLVQEKEANVVIFNIDLSSTQQRNLEDILQTKTIDRTQLILDIFAQHAKSNAGKIQVELAQLEYLLPRLKGKGIMLSRLAGGIGTRGPGERKLEIERRRIDEHISRLKRELSNLRKHRELLRLKRKREGFFLVSLVGYTNAGKTTLLNSLTSDNQKTEEALFTTLDPLSRILNLQEKVLISDTVGFIHHLPQKLMEAFKATLEELEYADLLVHLIDLSKTNLPKIILTVENILKELSLDEKPCFYVFNKLDKVSPELAAALKMDYPESLFISAKGKNGLKELIAKIEEKVLENFTEIKVSVPYQNRECLNFIYRKTRVLNSEYSSQDKILFTLRMRKEDFKRLRSLLSPEKDCIAKKEETDAP